MDFGKSGNLTPMTPRTLAIGDIHGCLTALETLADAVGFTDEDTVVTLGDHVDRGSDTKGVIDFLLGLRRRTQFVALRGNHEAMMLDARDHRPARQSWLNVGGSSTLESYGAEALEDIPVAHWQFIESLLPYHESERHIFVHANLDPALPLEDQHEADLFWESFRDPAPHISGKTMVCGHTSQKSARIKRNSNAICIDTYAHGGGWLTCLDVDTDRYWQANERGEAQIDILEDFEIAGSG